MADNSRTLIDCVFSSSVQYPVVSISGELTPQAISDASTWIIIAGVGLSIR
ncbi:hypothetical protein RO3G_13680 [Rhizopus delemar RA 99-880]|uniref:Uncharacterized protein n=1 Tax=Rhizopus delemar (strain RA 99-880 / ATCC MYA-4621 / FGSC 9543 / NRRL 43880) TaxID=246409 RepID=I1CKI9_RHIO9|nr:hypothetical protein RO3G_13680 [Rhizopus delemar RA 99-880]|eukprot:EIE88969.1 hypothetical protein RO3G_13680 [Rhizopus delemar RA 99-880]